MDLALHRPLATPATSRWATSRWVTSRWMTGWRRSLPVALNWLASRRNQVGLMVGVVLVERAVALAFGIEGLAGFGAGAGLLFVGLGHCDTLDGPLVTLGTKALEEKNVNLVLPWVRADDEGEVRHAFEHAQAVRTLSPEARTLADRHFLETLVRMHRAGEGAPFTGLKPAGLDLGPAVPAADRALELGAVDPVVELLVDAVSAGVRERFHAAVEKLQFDPNDVPAGRRYVDAYVPYVHYVEELWNVASGAGHGHGQDDGAAADAHAHAAKPHAHHH